MDFTVNYLDLNDNEFSSFHDSLKLKVVKNANQFYEKYERLETNYEKFKIEYEQRFVDLETEHNQLKDNYEREIVECQTFKLKFNEIGMLRHVVLGQVYKELRTMCIFLCHFKMTSIVLHRRQ